MGQVFSVVSTIGYRVQPPGLQRPGGLCYRPPAWGVENRDGGKYGRPSVWV
jgi:hypothetical protein